MGDIKLASFMFGLHQSIEIDLIRAQYVRCDLDVVSSGEIKQVKQPPLYFKLCTRDSALSTATLPGDNKKLVEKHRFGRQKDIAVRRVWSPHW